MADVFDKTTRSAVMRKVRSRGNISTEMKLIRIFDAHGIRGWRRHYPVKGHPDFIFSKGRIAVFVDGCFWHGHDCRNTSPKQNEGFWVAKRDRNKAHDKAVTEEFQARGWTVLRIWECELKEKNQPNLLEKLSANGIFAYVKLITGEMHPPG